MKLLVVFFLASVPVWAGTVNPDVRFAVERDDVQALEGYIQRGEATVDSLVVAPPFRDRGMPLITLAAREGSLEVAKFLIARGANLNAFTPAEETALMMASFFKDEHYEEGRAPTNSIHEEIVVRLLEAGAEVNSRAGWHSALSYAAYQGHNSVVRRLASAGADLHNFAPVKGEGGVPNPLMVAILNGQDSTVHLLLELGANPLRSWVKSENAFTFAEKNNRKYLVKYLECALGLQPGETYKGKCSRL